jgi:hypothetical protein
VRIEGLSIDGNRRAVEKVQDLPPSNVAFIDFTPNNGLLFDNSSDVRVTGVRVTGVGGFAVLAARSSRIFIEDLEVSLSGSKNAKGRNNTTGGVLFEEATSEFTVRRSKFTDVLGNGIWTHSLYTSARNAKGLIEENTFRRIGRDAIQVGHATDVRVAGNTGTEIGYPVSVVDVENGATPVVVDTSGNVDKSSYLRNQFTEVNGKCIDLDGFHHGEVRFNSCVNRGKAEDYPNGHFGIVVNNWNPDMTSEDIVIADNTIEGSKFGGIFLIGRNHQVLRNRLLRLNLAGCNESASKFGCVAIQGEPAVLESGIYLGRIAAEWAQKRAAPSSGHVIRENVISGHKMKERCIAGAPGVDLKASTIERNDCKNE